MCGICGIYQKRGEPVQPEWLDAMADRIIHRGPDDVGIHLDGEVGLGFRRLSIIDVEGGHQPLFNEDGRICVVFNGEIYNYRELRDQLLSRGHTFRTDSDTEVIVHLYEDKGIDCFRELRGMFALAIWDRFERRLVLARDYFGIKPLYYAETQNTLAFGSEIKSLLEVPGIGAEVDPEMLWNYFTFQYTPDPYSLFQGIMKLPPAHYMVIDDRGRQIKPYWTMQFTPDESKPMSYYIEGTRELLRESVRAHMNSDVPRGAFLSSGVDSSAIVALLREMEQVKTFTVGFEGAGAMSEIAYARETAEWLGTQHHDTVITAKEYWEALPRLAYYQDEPVADPSAIALYFVSQLASQHVTVVLSGEGADEIFGGYTIYREPLSLRMFDYVPPGLRASLGNVAGLLPEGMRGRSFLLRGSKTVEQRFIGNANIFDEPSKDELLVQGRRSHSWKTPQDITHTHYARVSSMDDVTKMQYIDLQTWLPGDILMKADKMTMANSLELRVPFLDRKVFEFASSIPASYRLEGGTTKYVLREAVKDILPQPVWTRKKLGFPVPTRTWLAGTFYPYVRQLIEETRCDHLINRDVALRLLEEHREGKRDNGRRIWTIVMFLLWYQIYVDRKISFQSSVHPNVAHRRSTYQPV